MRLALVLRSTAAEPDLAPPPAMHLELVIDLPSPSVQRPRFTAASRVPDERLASASGAADEPAPGPVRIPEASPEHGAVPVPARTPARSQSLDPVPDATSATGTPRAGEGCTGTGRDRRSDAEGGVCDRSLPQPRRRGRLGMAGVAPPPSIRSAWAPLVAPIEPELADDRMIAARFGWSGQESGPPSDPDLPSLAGADPTRRRRRRASRTGSSGHDAHIALRPATVRALVALAAIALAMIAGLAALAFASSRVGEGAASSESTIEDPTEIDAESPVVHPGSHPSAL